MCQPVYKILYCTWSHLSHDDIRNQYYPLFNDKKLTLCLDPTEYYALNNKYTSTESCIKYCEENVGDAKLTVSGGD